MRRHLLTRVFVPALWIISTSAFGADAVRRTADHAVGTVAPRSGINTVAVGARVPATKFRPEAIEAYVAPELIEYIRPGVKVKIVGITNVAAGQKPVVEILITDDLDQPLDREGKVTPGAVTPSFILARWDADPRQYFAYTLRTRAGVTQPAADQNGQWAALELGHYKYTFGTALPADLDATKTLTLGVYGRRVMTDIIGKDYYIPNVFKDFRPDGGAASAVWNAMTASATCNNCHDPIAFHGGTRREVKLCALCHTPQAALVTNGNTIDLKVFIHKIHSGENLPSVKAGTRYVAVNDFSDVTYPQDIRNCDTCHAPSAPEASIWYTRPSSKACGSCHDNVNFTTGENHAAGAQVDSTCASCHAPVGEREFDASIQGAHTVPYRSTQLAGFKAEIVSVDQVAAGKNPVVTFKLTNGDGSAVDPKPLGSSLNLLMGGPTSDYSIQPFRENASGAAFNGTVATYTFTNAIPGGATGTWAFSIEARRTVVLDPNGPHKQNFTEGARNPVVYAAVTGAVVPRRTIVDQDNCEKCHDRLALHGGQRLVVEECLICHNPNGDDSSRRPATAGKPESINFKRMIHRIHTGTELTQDYTVYGFGGSVNPFNGVTYPGDRRDCLQCHDSTATYELPTGGTLDTPTPRDYFGQVNLAQGPGTAACLGCHDNKDAAAHAYLNTSPFGEACATCHGSGKDWDVAKEHAR